MHVAMEPMWEATSPRGRSQWISAEDSPEAIPIAPSRTSWTWFVTSFDCIGLWLQSLSRDHDLLSDRQRDAGVLEAACFGCDVETVDERLSFGRGEFEGNLGFHVVSLLYRPRERRNNDGRRDLVVNLLLDGGLGRVLVNTSAPDPSQHVRLGEVG